MSSITEKFNVQVSGLGDQAMIFAHGFGCDQNMWRLVEPNFRENYKTLLFDNIGCGKSDSSFFDKNRYSSLDGYAMDLLEIINDQDLQDIIYVGHSVSAMIGVIAATKQPNLFSKLILVGPSPRYINDDKYVGGFESEDIEGLLTTLESNYLGWSSTMAPQIMGNTDRPELGEELTNSFCQMDPEIAKVFARTTFYSDNRVDLKKVKADCLVLQCSNDIIAPIEVGEYVNQQLPKSILKIMKATGHCPNLSAPQETTDCIKDFLNQ